MASVATLILPAPALADGPPSLIESKPYQRWAWAYQQRAYPLDSIPEGTRLRALAQIAAAEARQQTSPLLALSAALNDPTSQPSSWRNIGPTPIADPFVSVDASTPKFHAYGSASGRIESIAVDPRNPSHWLIGAAQGGVWESFDAGATWTPKTDDQASLAMGAMAFAPGNPNIIYAGTGEAAFSGDSYAGAGLLKSFDAGNTWQLLATATFAKTSFAALLVDPSDSNTLLAATTSGRAGRGGERLPSAPPQGIFKSTDGGGTWSQQLSGQGTALLADPTGLDRLYAGLGNIFGQDVNGVYRSTNRGNSWAKIDGPWSNLPGGIGRVVLAIAPSDPNILYVSMQDAIDGTSNDDGLLGLWVTTNAWEPAPTWTSISVKMTDDGSGLLGYCGWDVFFQTASRQCSYDQVLSVDPTNPRVLYAGGIPLWKFAGDTWTNVSYSTSTTPRGIHVDQHAMAWVGTRLIVGNDGGLWSTPDGGVTWIDHNTTLSITQFYGGALSPTNTAFALGGSQDNGAEVWTGAGAWKAQLDSGDGAAAVLSSSNPETQWAVAFQNLGIERTGDGGQTGMVVSTGIDTSTALFVAPFQACPADENVVIAGTNTVWRTETFFSSPSAPPWVNNNRGPLFGGGISALAFASSDRTCRTYAVGTQRGSLFLTTTGGQTWVNLDAGNAVPGRFVTALVFDPTDANTLYVTLSGFDEGTPGQPGHLFKTTAATKAAPTWFNVSPPVNIPHNSLVLHSASPNIVLVGTDLGVWQSIDAGSTWAYMGPATGMPNVAVFDLKFSPAAGFVAFTHGRGAFQLAGSALGGPTITGFSCDANIQTGGPGSCTITLSAAPASDTSLPVRSDNPEVAAVPASVTVQAGRNRTNFSYTGQSTGTAVLTAGPLNVSTATTPVTVLAPPPPSPTSQGGGGCTVASKSSGIDPILMALLLSSAGVLAWKRFKRGRRSEHSQIESS